MADGRFAEIGDCSGDGLTIFRISKGVKVDSGREFETVESVVLDEVATAEMEFLDEEPRDDDLLILGGMSAFIGILGFLWGLEQSEPLNQIGAIGGLLFIFIGIGLIGKAFDTDEGGVNLLLSTSSGESRSVWLPRERKDFAEIVVNGVGD